MKVILIALVLLLTTLTSCSADLIPQPSNSLPTQVRLHDRDSSKSMYADFFHGFWVDDVQDEIWEWQQEHPSSEILDVRVSVGFKVHTVTIVYQE